MNIYIYDSKLDQLRPMTPDELKEHLEQIKKDCNNDD